MTGYDSNGNEVFIWRITVDPPEGPFETTAPGQPDEGLTSEPEFPVDTELPEHPGEDTETTEGPFETTAPGEGGIQTGEPEHPGLGPGLPETCQNIM